MSALSALEQPDKRSRSTKQQGRRIIRLDDHRDWGWQIVNFQAYHKIRDQNARRENNRRYQKNHRQRKAAASAPVSTCQPKSAQSAHTDVDVYADVDHKDLHNTHPPAKPAKAPPKTNSSPAHFDAFWTAYPKKVARKAALSAWSKCKDRPPIAEILAALTAQKDSEQWTKDNGQFIPNPATWINQARWADETPLLKIHRDHDNLKAQEAIERSVM
jgi:hypothetical protein